MNQIDDFCCINRPFKAKKKNRGKIQGFDNDFVQQKGTTYFHGHRLFHTKIPYPKAFSNHLLLPWNSLKKCPECIISWATPGNLYPWKERYIGFIPTQDGHHQDYYMFLIGNPYRKFYLPLLDILGGGMDPKYTPKVFDHLHALKIGRSVGRVIFFQMVLFNFQGLDCWTIKPVPFW